MEKLILEIPGSSVCGDVWSSLYWLKGDSKRGFTLRYEFSMDMEASELPLPDVKPLTEIHDGAELYEVLAEMLAEDDISLSELDLAAIAERIAQLDTELTAEPSNAPDTQEQREEAEREIARVNREKAL